MTEERGAWRKRRVIDVAVQSLVHAKDELRHAANLHAFPGLAIAGSSFAK
jgi:hypothetical protein